MIKNPRLIPLKKPLPKGMISKRGRIFGVTVGAAAESYPTTWSINAIKGVAPSKISVQGHAHSVKLANPRFDKIDTNKMWGTRGYLKPKNMSDDLVLNTRGKERLAKGKKTAHKDRYAFIEGDIKDLKEYQQLSEITLSTSNPKAKYKKGGFTKVDLDALKSGERDYFSGQKLKNGSNRRLIGKEEYDVLTQGGKKKLPKGKYHLVSEVQLEPNGKMYYYNVYLPNYCLIDF